MVPRACLGSIEALKNTTVQVAKQSDNNIQRFYHIFNAGNNLGEGVSNKVEKLLNVKQGIDISKVDRGKKFHHIILLFFIIFYYYFYYFLSFFCYFFIIFYYFYFYFYYFYFFYFLLFLPIKFRILTIYKYSSYEKKFKLKNFSGQSVATKLVPPGRVIHMYKENGKKELLVEESDHDLFTEIVVSNTMYTDHMPLKYEAAFVNLLQSSFL